MLSFKDVILLLSRDKPLENCVCNKQNNPLIVSLRQTFTEFFQDQNVS